MTCATCKFRGRTPYTLRMKFCKAPASLNPIWAPVATSIPLVHSQSGLGCNAYRRRQ